MTLQACVKECKGLPQQGLDLGSKMGRSGRKPAAAPAARQAQAAEENSTGQESKPVNLTDGQALKRALDDHAAKASPAVQLVCTDCQPCSCVRL